MSEQQHLHPNWNLESIFPGGSSSPELDAHLTAVEGDTARLTADLGAAAAPDLPTWTAWLTRMQALSQRLTQASAFVGCLTAQNIKDEKAKQVLARVRQLAAGLNSAWIALDRRMLALSEGEWEQVLATPVAAPIAFALRERRQRALERLAPEQETLAGALGVDGYHGWNDLYNIVVGRMTVEVETSGKVEQLSVGQAANRLRDADRAVRSATFTKWEEAWQGQAELCAAALNHLAGYRLALYKQRGWDSVLQEPLHMSRLSQPTLQTMWRVITAAKPHFVQYLERKAKLLGVAKLAWHDVEAPLGAATGKVSYDEGAAFVVEQFRRFSPQLADFTQGALDQRWVESEDRPGKRPGAFCTSFPVTGETRVFMTFDGSPNTVSTLAHELGHAYHAHVLKELPQLARGYGMSLAETASTFAEMIISDASIKRAQEPAERLALLEAQVQNAVVYFMNIYCRFLFETRFYAAREKGVLTVAQLNALMQEAQEEAFGGALSDYHPGFWAAKLHFYNTGVPFYNFPYTFGYTFSAGIYAQALQEGPGFEEKYVALLRDTGRMTVEEVAQRHLGVDLTQPDFWQQAVGLAVRDVAEFLRLTEQ